MTIVIFTYILYFFFYSAAGWLIESIYCSLGEKKLINRGFLVGPMCPIYGTGTLVMAVLLYNPFRHNPIMVFILGMILCDIVEFITSLLMEKFFNARWWDYTDELMNIQGRICFKHTLYWGVGSLLFVRFVHPRIVELFERIPDNYIIPLTGTILAVFTVDVIYSAVRAAGINKLKRKLYELKELLLANTGIIKSFLDDTYYTIKDEAGSKYQHIAYNLEAMYNEINTEINKNNEKINYKRDELIWQAQCLITGFEEKVLSFSSLKKAKTDFKRFLSIYKKFNRSGFSKPSIIYKEISGLLEEIKQISSENTNKEEDEK